MLPTVLSRPLIGLAFAAMLSSTTVSQAAGTPAAASATPAASAAVAKKKAKQKTKTTNAGGDIKAGGTKPALDSETKPHGAGVKGPGIPKRPPSAAPAAASKP